MYNKLTWQKNIMKKIKNHTKLQKNISQQVICLFLLCWLANDEYMGMG
jgi:hypothetical protein